MRHFLIGTLALMAVGLCSAEALRPNAGPFESAEVVSAEDVRYSAQSAAVGAVVLEITVSEKGEVEAIRSIREIPSLTEEAVKSVRRWQFKPALLYGKPTRSRTAVAVIFNSVATYPLETVLGGISATEAGVDSTPEPEPIKVTSASFVKYPFNSLATGTVVIRANIDAEGLVRDVVVIRDVRTLTGPCLEGLKRWKFQPAELRGSPISSSICVAFVLRPPNGS